MPDWDWNLAQWRIAIVATSGVIFATERGIFVVGRWVQSVNSAQNTFKEFVTTVGDDLKEIQKDIKRIFFLLPNPNPAVEGHSPVQLTDFGQKIPDMVNASQWAEEHAPDLVASASGLEEFEVFDLCVTHVLETYEEDEAFQKLVRSGAYENGTDDTNVLKVFNVVLRDRVLATRR